MSTCANLGTVMKRITFSSSPTEPATSVLKTSDPCALEAPTLRSSVRRSSAAGAARAPEGSRAPCSARQGCSQVAPFPLKYSCPRFPGAHFSSQRGMGTAPVKPWRAEMRGRPRHGHGPSASPGWAPAAAPSSPRAGGPAAAQRPCLPLSHASPAASRLFPAIRDSRVETEILRSVCKAAAPPASFSCPPHAVTPAHPGSLPGVRTFPGWLTSPRSSRSTSPRRWPLPSCSGACCFALLLHGGAGGSPVCRYVP